MHAAARDDHGALGRLEQPNRFLDAPWIGNTTLDAPGMRLEEIKRIFVSVRLDVLRQRQDYRSCLDWIGQDAHGFGQCRKQLLRARDAIKEAADRAEAIVYTHVRRNGMLQLLQ